MEHWPKIFVGADLWDENPSHCRDSRCELKLFLSVFETPCNLLKRNMCKGPKFKRKHSAVVTYNVRSILFSSFRARNVTSANKMSPAHALDDFSCTILMPIFKQLGFQPC